MKLEYSSKIFEKNAQVSNSMKIRPVGDEPFHADGQTEGLTDITKRKVAFRNFVNGPKDWGTERRYMLAHVTVSQQRNHYRRVSLHITTSYKHRRVSWANQIKRLAVSLHSRLTHSLQYQQDIVQG